MDPMPVPSDASPSSALPGSRREFSFLEGLAFLISGIGVQFSSELFAQWGSFFYSPPPGTGRTVFVPIGLVALIFVAGRVFDAITDPLVGHWSDRTSHGRRAFGPRGRRMPFIFWGSILMTISGIAFWHPPVEGESIWNLIYGTVTMAAHWGFYTLAYIPILALAPEVARSHEERLRLGAWIAIGMTLGLAGAVVLPGELVVALDPARLADPDARSVVGYQRVAVVFALVSLASFQFLVWTVRERYDGTGGETPELARGLGSALASRGFRAYLLVFGLFYLGLLAMQRAAPYWAELGLGGDESTMSDLGIPFVVGSLVSIAAAPALARRIGVRRLTILALGLMSVALPFTWPIARSGAPEELRLAWGRILFAVEGIGLGFVYVVATPLLGAVVDADERSTGFRREALFNALQAMMVKGATILSIALSTVLMGAFGNSSDRPEGVFLVGPVGGAICLLGVVAAMRYPMGEEREPQDRKE